MPPRNATLNIIPLCPPNPMGDALARLGMPASLLFLPDQSQGVAFVRPADGRLGLLVWATVEAHAAPDLGAQILWGRADQLLLRAVEAERALGFDKLEGLPLISAELRALARRSS